MMSVVVKDNIDWTYEFAVKIYKDVRHLENYILWEI